jgi:malate synthase
LKIFGMFPEQQGDEILTPAAAQFLRELDQRFEERRVKLLSERRHRQEQFGRGVLPGFLA